MCVCFLCVSFVFFVFCCVCVWFLGGVVIFVLLLLLLLFVCLLGGGRGESNTHEPLGRQTTFRVQFSITGRSVLISSGK